LTKLSVPTKGPHVFGIDLNCSESRRWFWSSLRGAKQLDHLLYGKAALDICAALTDLGRTIVRHLHDAGAFNYAQFKKSPSGHQLSQPFFLRSRRVASINQKCPLETGSFRPLALDLPQKRPETA
jgi:hypothetical protein